VGLTKRIRLAPTMWWDPVVRGPGINIRKEKRKVQNTTQNSVKNVHQMTKNVKKTPKPKFLPRTHK
jgi:hypothetical protein